MLKATFVIKTIKKIKFLGILIKLLMIYIQ